MCMCIHTYIYIYIYIYTYTYALAEARTGRTEPIRFDPFLFRKFRKPFLIDV